MLERQRRALAALQDALDFGHPDVELLAQAIAEAESAGLQREEDLAPRMQCLEEEEGEEGEGSERRGGFDVFFWGCCRVDLGQKERLARGMGVNIIVYMNKICWMYGKFNLGAKHGTQTCS